MLGVGKYVTCKNHLGDVGRVIRRDIDTDRRVYYTIVWAPLGRHNPTPLPREVDVDEDNLIVLSIEEATMYLLAL